MARIDATAPGTGRRKFFRRLVGEAAVFVEELRGRPQLRLNLLAKLSDEALATIIPVVSPDIEITVTEDHVCARRHGKSETLVLFGLEPENTFVFNRFNGSDSIAQISSALSAAMSWDESRSFAHIKNLFLELVCLGVCLPVNAIER